MCGGQVALGDQVPLVGREHRHRLRQVRLGQVLASSTWRASLGVAQRARHGDRVAARGCRDRRSRQRRASARPAPARSSDPTPPGPAVREAGGPGDRDGSRRRRASGTASSTCRSRGGSRSRGSPWRAAPAAGRRPIGPTASSTSSPEVTSSASPERSSSWTPAEGALVTGPGTPISDAAEAGSPSCAVLSAPLRTAASTTTVPRVSAAISRLRARNRSRVGAQPGAASETTSPDVGDVVEQRRVRRRVGPVGAAGQHRDRGARRGESPSVGGAGRCRRRPRTRRSSRLASAVRRCRPRRRAVGGRGPGADHRHRAVRGLAKSSGPRHPQPERRTALPFRCGSRGEVVEGAGHSRRPARRSGCPSVGRVAQLAARVGRASRSATSARAPPRGHACWRRWASTALLRARAPARPPRRSPGSLSATRAARASRSRRSLVRPHRAASRRTVRSSSGAGAGAQTQRDVELGEPGPRRRRRGRPRSRRAGGPGSRLAG